MTTALKGHPDLPAGYSSQGIASVKLTLKPVSRQRLTIPMPYSELFWKMYLKPRTTLIFPEEQSGGMILSPDTIF